MAFMNTAVTSGDTFMGSEGNLRGACPGTFMRGPCEAGWILSGILIETVIAPSWNLHGNLRAWRFHEGSPEGPTEVSCGSHEGFQGDAMKVAVTIPGRFHHGIHEDPVIMDPSWEPLWNLHGTFMGIPIQTPTGGPRWLP